MAGMRSTKRARRALERLGFVFIDADGSHYHYRAPNGRKITVVLGHKEISEASLRKTCALTDVAWSDFEEQY
jgi:predicted RNA binding protein YcfA (HicA-like mRNA interferase family)